MAYAFTYLYYPEETELGVQLSPMLLRLVVDCDDESFDIVSAERSDGSSFPLHTLSEEDVYKEFTEADKEGLVRFVIVSEHPTEKHQVIEEYPELGLEY